MQLDKLYTNRDHLLKYSEQAFVELDLNIGLRNPVLFISNKVMTQEAGYFSLDPIEEQNYDINIVTSDSCVLLYIINVKAPLFKVFSNGIIIRNRMKWDNARDMEGITARYTFDDFIVVANKNQTSAVFCKNVTSDQKT